MFHCHVAPVSRSTGRSSVQSAAYIAGAKLIETRRGLTVNFSNRENHVPFSKTYMFGIDDAHQLSQEDALELWDKLESFEDELARSRFKDKGACERFLARANMAKTITISLPIELSLEQQKEILEEFTKENFEQHNLLVLSVIHDSTHNPHAHIQISERELVCDEKGNLTFSRLKNRAIKERSFIRDVRKSIANITNKYLEMNGIERRVTEKSFLDCGINLSPTHHRGVALDHSKMNDNEARILTENQKTIVQNANQIIADPNIVLTYLSVHYATFTQKDVLNFINRYLSHDDAMRNYVFEHVIDHAHYLGSDLHGCKRYATKSYVEKERTFFQHMDALMTDQTHGINAELVEKLVDKNYSHMTEEQRNATCGLTQGSAFSVLQGRAGTGKTSTTVKAVCELYSDFGYTVLGGAFAKSAADNMHLETGISSRTLHSYLMMWEKFEVAEKAFLSFKHIQDEGILKQFEWYKDLQNFKKFQLTKDTAFVLDEAGMVNVDLYTRLIHFVHKAGAKLILVGDGNQCAAIGAGNIFSKIEDVMESKGQLHSLTKIMRQKVDWMREASVELSQLMVRDALIRYDDHGLVHGLSHDTLLSTIAHNYIEHINRLNDDGSHAFKSGCVLSFTNQAVFELNGAIRSLLKQTPVNGFTLGSDIFSKPSASVKEAIEHFALGDKIVFLKNDKTHVKEHGVLSTLRGSRHSHKGVSNGTEGIISHYDEKDSMLVVVLNDGRHVSFSTHDYTHFTHAYALTIHKSQGKTVDFTLLYATKNMDAKLNYVAMSRHREICHVYYNTSEFKTFNTFAYQMEHIQKDDLAENYTSLNDPHYARVLKFVDLTHEAREVYAELSFTQEHELNTKDNDVLTHYLRLKVLQKEAARDICSHLKACKPYLRMAGIKEHQLKEMIGEKMRPLSLEDKKNIKTLELLGETTHTVRLLWNDIKKMPNRTQHPYYQQYIQLREERDQLSKSVLDNIRDYTPFMRDFSRKYGISKEIMRTQLKSRNERLEKQVIKESIGLKASFDFEYKRHHDNATTHPSTHTDIKDEVHQREQNKVKRFDLNVTSTSKEVKEFNYTKLEIVSELKNHAAEIAIELFGKPTSKNSRQLRFGNKGSVALDIAGSHMGRYTNFESGVKGNIIHLIAEQLHLSNKEAFKWGANWLGIETTPTKTSIGSSESINSLAHTIDVKQPQVDILDPWKPIDATGIDFPNVRTSPALKNMARGRHIVSMHTYKNEDGGIIGYVVRLEDKDGNKITPMLTYCENTSGDKQWRFKGFGDSRPLYGLDHLQAHPNRPVLIVEGEKTCDAARELFKDHVVVTWSGGCGSIAKTDWSVLANRNVTIFPDHDNAGLNAAIKIGDIITNQRAKISTLDEKSPHAHTPIHIVDLPSTLPHKWDLADEMADGHSAKELLENSKEYTIFAFNAHQKKMNTIRYKFSSSEILACAKKYELTHIVHKADIPYIQYVAEYSNTLFEKQQRVLNIQNRENTNKEHAILAGLLGNSACRAKNLDKTKDFGKIILTGCFGAEPLLKGGKKGSDGAYIEHGLKKVTELDEKIDTFLKDPPDSIKHMTSENQKALVRHSYISLSMTGQNMPKHMTKAIIQTLDQSLPNNHNYAHAAHVIEHFVEKLALGTTREQGETIHPEVISMHAVARSQSFKLTQQQMLSIPKEQQINHSRGFEIGF